jgi:D-cysteine desulfhydrase
MTFGGLGTNHGMATALYAGRLGFSCDLVLVDQPIDDAVRRRLRQFRGVGADLHYGKTVAGTARKAIGVLLRHPRTTIIATGGSSPAGVLGFIDAGLELAEQIRRGDLPEPARVYVALGTGGTVAGLAAGLSLAGVRVTVVGVLVTDILPPTPRRIDRLARRALQLLARAGAAVEPDRLTISFEIDAGHVGDGYGHRTERGTRAVELVERLEGIRLDTTYTGKALGALLAREKDGERPIVFWNTYAEPVPEMPIADPRDLPAPFHPFFKKEQ